MVLAPGAVIGNYVLEHELGRGGMGAVYAATHRVLGRPAAIKVLLQATADHRDRVERFFNEARAAMAIDHPGIVTIHDVGVSADGRPYIAMERLAGRSLEHRLVHGALPVRVAIDYARQIAEALAAAHAAGIIHRDLKPENVIVLDGGHQLKLVDFGIAKLAGAVNVRTATGALLGTPLYMSPEQCDGTRDVDARSDLYSLGCVLYAMLAGAPPFDGGGTGAVIGSHLHVPPPPLAPRCPAASPALVALVETLLAKAPAARLQTARAVVTALSTPGVSALAASGDAAVTADGPAPDRTPRPMTMMTPAAPVRAGASPRPVAPATLASLERQEPAHAPPPPAPAPTSAPASPGAPPAHAPSATRSPGARPIALTIALVLGTSAITAVVVILATRGGGDDHARTAARADAAIGSGAVAALGAPPPDAAPSPAPATDATLAARPAPDVRDPAPRRTPPPPRDPPRAAPPDAAPPPPDAAPPATASRAPDAAPPPPSAPAGGVSGRLAFAHGEHAPSAGLEVLDRVARAARADPTAAVRVVGVASTAESRPDNLALARANRVKLELVNRGIDRDRIRLEVSVVDGETREVRVSLR